MKAYKAHVDSQQKTGNEHEQLPAFFDEINAAFGWKPNLHPRWLFYVVGGPLVLVTRPPKRSVEFTDSERRSG